MWFTFVGKGQSSSKIIITEGPKGLLGGMTLTIEITTCIQPSSWSAMACNFCKDGGGSCSLKVNYDYYSIIINLHS